MPNPSEATFELVFSPTLVYDIKQLVPAEELATALLAFERIVQRVPRILYAIQRTPQPKRTEVFVESIEEGSLIERFIVKFFFRSEAELDRYIEKWRKALKLDKGNNAAILRHVVVAAIAGALMLGVYGAISGCAKNASDVPHVEVKDNVIIQLGASELSLKPEEFIAIVDKAITRRSSLPADAVDVVKPAKTGGGSIKLNDEVLLTSDLVARMPNEAPPTKTEDVVYHEKVDLYIRATDLDNSDKGWAALVPDISDDRIRLELSPAIRAERLYGQRKIVANINAVYSEDAKGTRVLRKYILEQVVADEASSVSAVKRTYVGPPAPQIPPPDPSSTQ